MNELPDISMLTPCKKIPDSGFLVYTPRNGAKRLANKFTKSNRTKGLIHVFGIKTESSFGLFGVKHDEFGNLVVASSTDHALYELPVIIDYDEDDDQCI